MLYSFSFLLYLKRQTLLQQDLAFVPCLFIGTTESTISYCICIVIQSNSIRKENTLSETLSGNYLLLNGDYESKDIVPLMIEMFEFIRDFEGEIPGASAKDCGNYLDMNLGMAKYLAKKYLNEVLYDIKPDRLVYPE